MRRTRGGLTLQIQPSPRRTLNTIRSLIDALLQVFSEDDRNFGASTIWTELQSNISSIQIILHQLHSDSDTIDDETRSSTRPLRLSGLESSGQLSTPSPQSSNMVNDLEDFASSPRSPQSEWETPADLDSIASDTILAKGATDDNRSESSDGLFVPNVQTPYTLTETPDASIEVVSNLVPTLQGLIKNQAEHGLILVDVCPTNIPEILSTGQTLSLPNPELAISRITEDTEIRSLICNVRRRPQEQRECFQMPDMSQSEHPHSSLKEIFDDAVSKDVCGVRYLIMDADNARERDRLGLPSASLVHCGQRLAQTRERLPGIHTPHAYLGWEGSISALHYEDAGLASMNLVMAGAAKLWLYIFCADNGLLEQKLRCYGLFSCSQRVRHLNVAISPALLELWGIRYGLRLCRKGQMIVAQPYTYYQVLNLGHNLAEAVNFAPDDSWEVPQNYQFCAHDCLEHLDSEPITAEMLTISSQATLEARELDGSEGIGEDTAPEIPPVAEPFDTIEEELFSLGDLEDLSSPSQPQTLTEVTTDNSAQSRLTQAGELECSPERPLSPPLTTPLGIRSGEQTMDDRETPYVENTSINRQHELDADTLSSYSSRAANSTDVEPDEPPGPLTQPELSNGCNERNQIKSMIWEAIDIATKDQDLPDMFQDVESMQARLSGFIPGNTLDLQLLYILLKIITPSTCVVHLLTYEDIITGRLPPVEHPLPWEQCVFLCSDSVDVSSHENPANGTSIFLVDKLQRSIFSYSDWEAVQPFFSSLGSRFDVEPEDYHMTRIDADAPTEQGVICLARIEEHFDHTLGQETRPLRVRYLEKLLESWKRKRLTNFFCSAGVKRKRSDNFLPCKRINISGLTSQPQRREILVGSPLSPPLLNSFPDTCPVFVAESFANFAANRRLSPSLLQQAFLDTSFGRSGREHPAKRFRIIQMIFECATPDIFRNLLVQVKEAPKDFSLLDFREWQQAHEIVMTLRKSQRQQQYVTSVTRIYLANFRRWFDAKVDERRDRKYGRGKGPDTLIRKALYERYGDKIIKNDLGRGLIMKILGTIFGNDILLALLPGVKCTDLKLRMEKSSLSGTWLATADPIRCSEYERLAPSEARFFAKWLPILRPNLCKLRESKFQNVLQLLSDDAYIQSDIVKGLEQLEDDSHCFIDILCDEKSLSSIAR